MGKLPGQKLIDAGFDSRGDIEPNINAQINNELQQSPVDTDKVLVLLSRSLEETREMLIILIKDFLTVVNNGQQAS